MVSEEKVRIYRNEDVEEIVAAIPVNHYHTRFLIKFKDQTIIIQEATAAAIVRAYALTVLHPIRKGVILRKRDLGVSPEKKKGFANHQLVEVEDSEESAVKTITEMLKEDSV